MSRNAKLPTVGVDPDVERGGQPYRDVIETQLGRALSRLDAEFTSPTRGSFDRTWWNWKFTDFSAARFQEGVYTLAWLHDSALAPKGARDNARLLDYAAAAVGFWARLQHADGSFDEAYPFERSLAATAFTGFYVGCGIARLRERLPAPARDAGLRGIERGARWLAANGEYHGVLSNHLAAAAAALQVAGELLASDRFVGARDRYLGIIYQHQDPTEGWLREYGGADPGYQSHGMFYLAEIWRRTRDAELRERLCKAAQFCAWFAHPDGTLGGEYASRGTKFAYPAGFEILARESPAAAAVAAHLRRAIVAGRGVGPAQMDAWNLFPLLNNYLFAAEAAVDPVPANDLPWQDPAGTRVFERAGLAVLRQQDRLLVAGLANGGAFKLWNVASGTLAAEDCGYAFLHRGRPFSSQSASVWRASAPGEFVVMSPFTAVPQTRFDPFRFVAFRLFTLTVGRIPAAAAVLKRLLVWALIRRKRSHAARLQRTIELDVRGRLCVRDRLSSVPASMMPLERHVPFHMGSARYADTTDWLGAQTSSPAPLIGPGATATRDFQV